MRATKDVSILRALRRRQAASCWWLALRAKSQLLWRGGQKKGCGENECPPRPRFPPPPNFLPRSERSSATGACQRSWRAAQQSYLLNHSFQFFGHPMRSSSANGAPQFGQRSIKSQIGSPTSGRTSAVQKPQNVAQSNTIRTGRTKTISAISKSTKPISVKRIVAVPISAPVS